MSQREDQARSQAEARTQETRSFVRQVRAAARRKYIPEEKIRIVLEGFRREVTFSDLCRREAVLARRKEVQRETFDRQRRYNQAVRHPFKAGPSPP